MYISFTLFRLTEAKDYGTDLPISCPMLIYLVANVILDKTKF